MAGQSKDDGHQPRWNVIIHPAGSDEERGMPWVGKICLRTDYTPPAYEYCQDTDPDPFTVGGGTWGPLGGGSGGGFGAWQLWTPVITQGGCVFTFTGGGLIRTDGVEARGVLAVDITGVASGTYPGDADGQTILITGHPVAATLASAFFLRLGVGVIDGADPHQGIVRTILSGSDTVTQLFSNDNPNVDVGVNHTLEAGDRLFYSPEYLCSDDL